MYKLYIDSILHMYKLYIGSILHMYKLYIDSILYLQYNEAVVMINYIL